MFTSSLEGRHTVIVGGSTGIGKAIGQAVHAAGGKVTLASRDRQKLGAAAASIGPGVVVSPIDMTEEANLAPWAAGLGPVHHLVITASSWSQGAFKDLPTSDLRRIFETKFFGPYLVVKAMLPVLVEGGSILFFSGALSRRPRVGTSGVSAVNGAVEALTRALALELGPALRVNAIAPGLVRTEAYDHLPFDVRSQMYAKAAEAYPAGRIGEPNDIAEAALVALTNGFMTGATIDVEGGYLAS